MAQGVLKFKPKTLIGPDAIVVDSTKCTLNNVNSTYGKVYNNLCEINLLLTPLVIRATPGATLVPELWPAATLWSTPVNNSTDSPIGNVIINTTGSIQFYGMTVNQPFAIHTFYFLL